MTETMTLSLVEIPPTPSVVGGMVRSIRDQKGKKMGGDRNISKNGAFSPAAHLFPPLAPNRLHHSAANAVSERNLQRVVSNYLHTNP
jgi:hypothetical protein